MRVMIEWQRRGFAPVFTLGGAWWSQRDSNPNKEKGLRVTSIEDSEFY